MSIRSFRCSCVRLALSALAIVWLSCTLAIADAPRTTAEQTNYERTTSYDELMVFCQSLAKDSPVVRLGKLGASQEGRELPLVIVADPPISTPAEAARSRKLVALVIANIHAGEVDGKEALLILAREIATAQERPLLKNMVLVLAPIFNADGNEKLANHRPTQAGPPLVGTRENAQQLDLNRDFVKLESPEVRALVRAMTEWNPAVFIDCHTTNGSYHRYTLTYEGGRNPAGDPRLVEYVSDTLLPAVTQKMEQATGYKSFFYGNFSRDRSTWETISPQPRYGIHYGGMRNRISILSESYTYASFKDRTLASKAFVQGILEHVSDNQAKIRELLAEADGATSEKIALRYEAAPHGGPTKLLGFVEESRDGRPRPTEQTKEYDLTYLGGTKPLLSVARPTAYVFPASLTAVTENLQRHGIEVEELREDVELDVEVYKVDAIRRANPFQKHALVTLEVTPRKESRRMPAGTVIVRTAQPLGSLAACLLEPQSSDGLVTWNFFDDSITQGNDFPVLRAMVNHPVHSGPVKPLSELRAQRRAPPARPFADPTWMADGEHFLQTRNNRQYKVHALSGRAEPLFDPEKLTAALKTMPGIDAETARTLANSPRLRMNPQLTGALFDQGGDLYYCSLDGAKATRLTSTPAREELASFSPNGKLVAFVRGNNLFVVDIATQTVRALTKDGNASVFNAKADWVYYEEIFGRNERAYWWSPDSSRIAFLRFDDTPIRKFTLADPINVQQRNEITSYPKAGAANPLVALASVAVSGEEPKFVDLSGYTESDRLINRVGWTPDSQELYCYVLNRAQTWLDVCFAAPSEGKLHRLTRLSTPAWVSNPGELEFLPGWSAGGERKFLVASDATGYRHHQLWDREGHQPISTITAGDWDARSVLHVDKADGWVYASTTKDNPIGTTLVRARLDGGPLQVLSEGRGEHRVSFSPNGKYYIETASNHLTRPQVKLRFPDGKLARMLDSNPDYSSDATPRSKYELVEITTPDGVLLQGSLSYPPNFDPTKKYPVWFMTYAGPGSPSIRDRWAAGHDEANTRLGFVVFHCDPRSASGRGAGSAWTAYRQLGVQEMIDIETAIGWLNQHPWVDHQRIGMSGHSYGGFMTSYAMTHSKLFAAGIAGAPVTDWRNYDSIYTERYMNTPQENPDGYDKSSVVKAAANLHGRLLLIHGLIDDNVHAQNTFQLVDALQRANKDFDLMVYPRSRHGINGQHYQRLMTDFMVRNLRPERPSLPAGESREDEGDAIGE